MLKKFVWLIILGLTFSLSCKGKASITASANPQDVVAIVDGINITDADVTSKAEPQMKKLEAEIYQIKKEALDDIINEKLISKAAAAEGKSPEQYLADIEKTSVKEPTEEDIKQFYEFRKNQMGGRKFEEVKTQIVEFLKASQKNSARQNLIHNLRAQTKIDIKMEPPRAKIEIGDGPMKGPKGADVTLVEFSDYQCPFCSRARPIVNQILEAYPKDVRYVFKDFPLNFHKQAQKAHEAAHCAGDQGKYWEMNKILFENQKALEISDLEKYANQIGLKKDKFAKCLKDGEHEKTVKENLQNGIDSGVTGTPAFFLNGVMISGARPFEDFKTIIDSELNRKK